VACSFPPIRELPSPLEVSGPPAISIRSANGVCRQIAAAEKLTGPRSQSSVTHASPPAIPTGATPQLRHTSHTLHFPEEGLREFR
jgi:hypothetical protein